MENYVDGKTLVVTGAAGGFGKLIAQKAARLDARVVLSDVNEAELAAAVTSVEDDGGVVLGVVADVRDRGAMAALAERAVEEFGSIDVMVNNAGVMPLAFFADHEEAAEAWERCIDINLKGVLNGIYAVHDAMIAQGRGHIVNIASIYGNYPTAGAAVYGATKAAVGFISEALRQESQGRIKVTTIRPTGVPTTGLGAGVINPEAINGVLGANRDSFMETMGALFSENPPAAFADPDRIEYFALSADLLADQVIFAINQPWGVSISDLTVRASGDSYMI